MSKIQNLSEPWNGHTFAEVQDFIKENFKYQPVCPQPEAVDLDLPSGTLWADRNVGASSPEDFGLYFSWGNVDGHRGVYNEYEDQWEIEDGYIFGGSYSNNTWTGGSYSKTLGSTLTSDIIPGAAAYDAARANLGTPWMMPTRVQMQELIENTTHSVIESNGVIGMLFTSNSNGNSIFLPSAGYANQNYIYNVGKESSGGGSSSGGGGGGYTGGGQLYSVNKYSDNIHAYLLQFGGGAVLTPYEYRYWGCSIRAVQ